MSRQMFGILLIVLAIIGAAIYYFTSGSGNDRPFDAPSPSLVYGVILVTVLLAGLVAARPSLGEVSKAIVGWGAIGLGLIALYAYQTEIFSIGNRTIAALIPGYVDKAGTGGEISVFRNADGHFRIAGLADGHVVGFLIDTGATSTVLTYRDAGSIGIDVSALNFAVPVSTANGRTFVAPTRLTRLDMGGLQRADFPVFVARQGNLAQSLLGMDFLTGLSSWRVEGDRLVLMP